MQWNPVIISTVLELSADAMWETDKSVFEASVYLRNLFVSV